MKKTYITPATISLSLRCEGLIATSTQATGLSVGGGSQTITGESGFNSNKKNWSDEIWSNME